MGGENPPWIDSGRRRMPTDFAGCREHCRRHRKSHQPSSRHIPGKAVEQPVTHQPSQQAGHQHRLKVAVGDRNKKCTKDSSAIR